MTCEIVSLSLLTELCLLPGDAGVVHLKASRCLRKHDEQNQSTDLYFSDMPLGDKIVGIPLFCLFPPHPPPLLSPSPPSSVSFLPSCIQISSHSSPVARLLRQSEYYQKLSYQSPQAGKDDWGFSDSFYGEKDSAEDKEEPVYKHDEDMVIIVFWKVSRKKRSVLSIVCVLCDRTFRQ